MGAQTETERRAVVGEGRPAIPDALEATRVVAILRRTAPDLAVETAAALLAGGVRAIEVTLDSPGATAMIAALRDRLGERILLGAGTVLDREAADAAIAAGARFIVSPHTDPELIAGLAREGVPCVPGAQTPTEILAAWRAGAPVVKLFPAGPLGPGYLKDLRGPLRQIPLLPTGGIGVENAPAFVAAGAWGLGVGSALVDAGIVAARRFDELTERARALAAIAAGARGQS